MNLLEAIARFRDLAEDNIAKASHIAEKLRNQLGSPTWLVGVGIIVDPTRSRAAVQVSVKNGYYASNLPKHIDGVPIIVSKTTTGTLPF